MKILSGFVKKNWSLITIIIIVSIIVSCAASMERSYKRVQKQDNSDEYEKFLKKFPDNPYQREIDENIWRLYLAESKDKTTPEALKFGRENEGFVLRAFMLRHPNSPFISEAKSHLGIHYYQLGKENNSISIYQRLIEELPDHPLVAKAQEEIKSLQAKRKAKRKADDPLNKDRYELLETYEIGKTTLNDFLQDEWNSEDPLEKKLGILQKRRGGGEHVMVLGYFKYVDKEARRLMGALGAVSSSMGGNSTSSSFSLGGDAIIVCELRFVKKIGAPGSGFDRYLLETISWLDTK